MFAADMQIY